MWRILKSWLGGPAGSSVALGAPSSIAIHLQRLTEAPPGASLVIEVDGPDDAFLQLTADAEVIQVNQPLITQAQQNREGALRRVLTSAGFSPYESHGSDASRFLDCDVPRDVTTTAGLLKEILGALYEIDSSSQLRFIGTGLPPSAAEAAETTSRRD